MPLGPRLRAHRLGFASALAHLDASTRLWNSSPRFWVRMAHQIAVIGGDGIGPEVTSEALKVVEAAGVELSTKEFDLGGARYLRDGEILSDATLDELRNYDAILLGAVGTPDVPPGVIERGLLLKMRFELDLYVNQRPFLGTAPGHAEPHDFIVIRENTEGQYVGEGGVLRKGTPHEVATQGSMNTRMGVERCVRYAFELAATRRRKHVTLVHKTNVLTFSGNLWERTFNEVAAEFTGIGTAYNHVDAACIYFVQDPHRYDVIVTDNLFGDILTDLGGAVSGGIGLASSANLNPARTGPSMFEPVHGSAPDIAGQNKANPTAAVLSAALMLDYLGESEAADRIRAACAEPVTGSTTSMGDTLAARVRH
jgi:3-isopropylmalate dehydrogenase